MLDTSSTGSFMNRTTEFKWDLLERIKRNSKDWEIEKGKVSGINLSLIVLNLVWKLMLFISLVLNMDLTLR